LSYALGLKRLGHRVTLVDPVRQCDIRPRGAPLADSTNAAYFEEVISRFDLQDDASLLRLESKETVGCAYGTVRERIAEADLLLNLSGLLTDDDLMASSGRRVYVDLDPAFTQLWHDVQHIEMGLDAHTDFVTVGLALGEACCDIPTGGRHWTTTLPPVLLEDWPVATPTGAGAWTTVANWRGYGSVEHAGTFYGQKVHSLRPLMALPTQVEEQFELALAIHPDERRDIEALDENGWQVVDPLVVAGTPHAFKNYVEQSKGEFAFAKSGYVHSRSGWFSDRSACYLAAGRPVIAQETGFSRFLPTGSGLFAFETEGDVVAAIAEVNADYRGHARAAHAIAEEYFDSDKVLCRLLDRLGGGA
jgi:hypothetical protein